MTHPYKTLRVIRLEKDLSQILILFAAPIISLSMLGVLVSLIKFVFQPSGILGQVVDILFFLLIAFFFLLITYLGYWFVYYLRVRRRVKRVT